MIKFISVAWKVWAFVSPIYKDIMRIIKEIKDKGLVNEEARKAAFQDITDFMQKNGLKSVPDSVLNCSIELCYQVYLWKK